MARRAKSLFCDNDILRSSNAKACDRTKSSLAGKDDLQPTLNAARRERTIRCRPTSSVRHEGGRKRACLGHLRRCKARRPQRSLSCSERWEIRWETDTTAGWRTLLRFERDKAAAALAPNAYQNLFVRLQLFADGHQLLRISDGLLVHFLDHVAFAQTSFCGRRIGVKFRNH